MLSAYRLTARSSSSVMWCCDPEPDRVVDAEDECDELEQLDLVTPWKMPGPSRDTERRAQDSSSECSGMMPSEMAELPTFGPPVVSRAGVECDSSWATVDVDVVPDDDGDDDGRTTHTGCRRVAVLVRRRQ